MKYSFLCMLIAFLPVCAGEGDLSFRLTIQGEDPIELMEDSRIAYEGEAEGFQLEAAENGSDTQFVLSCFNDSENTGWSSDSKCTNGGSLEVRISELPGNSIYCDYSIDAIGSEQPFSLKFSIVPEQTLLPEESATEWIFQQYPDLSPTQYGFVLPEGSSDSRYNGIDYTHIFLDRNGNSLCAVLPHGIPGRQYVVHVVHLASTETLNLDYLVRQTSGDYLDYYSIQGAAQGGALLPEVTLTGSGRQETGCPERYYWRESVTSLNASTSDIRIEVLEALSPLELNGAEDLEVISGRSISMTPVYHASIDVGLVSTNLSDPDYSLVMQSESIGVLKVSDDGNRGITSAMVTFYSSPVIWAQVISGADIPSYKLTGRSRLDDHQWYQRFFPSVGLELGSSRMESFLLGLCFEIARGANLFGGVHYARVSEMDLPDGFIPGETPMTQSQFDLLHKRKWDSGFAFGLTLDTRILLSLTGE